MIHTLPRIADVAWASAFAFCCVPAGVLATTIPVSGGGGALRDAVQAAPAGSTVLIQDSATYTGSIYVNKLISLRAAPGHSPVIVSDNSLSSSAMYVDRFASGSKIGDLSGGIIIIRQGPSDFYSLRLDRPGTFGNEEPVIFENLLLDGAGTGGFSKRLVFIQNTGIAGNPTRAIFNSVTFDRKGNTGYSIDHRGNVGVATTFDLEFNDCLFHGAGGVGGASIYINGSHGSIRFTRTTFREPNGARNIYIGNLAPVSSEDYFDLTFDRTWLDARTTNIRLGGSAGEHAQHTRINATRSAFTIEGTGGALAPYANFFIGQNSNQSQVHLSLCDLLNPNQDGYNVNVASGPTARSITVIDSNLHGDLCLVNSPPGDPTTVSYSALNRPSGNVVTSGFAQGVGNILNGPLPDYGNRAVGDLRYSNVNQSASSTAISLGANYNFASNALTAPQPEGMGFELEFTRDWYSEFIQYSDGLGTWYAANPDGGIHAWGEAYQLRMYLLLYHATGDNAWLDRMVTSFDLMLGSMSDVPLFSPYDPQYVDGYKSWGQNRYTQYAPHYTEWFGDHGNVIAPFMGFIETIWEDEALHDAYKSQADLYLQEIEENILLMWYNNFDPHPGWTPEDSSRMGSNAGYHVYEWSGWNNQPFNMYLGFTDAMVTLSRLVASPYYTPAHPDLPEWYDETSEEMLAYFRSHMQYDAADDLYVWKYGPTTAWPHLIEDVGHAFLDVEAAIQGARSSKGGWTEQDLQRMARTFVVNVWNGSLTNPSFRYYIDGVPNSLDSSRGHWGFGFIYLAKYEFDIWRSMDSYFGRYIKPLSAHASYISCTAGALALATILHDEWAPEAPDDLNIFTDGDNVTLTWSLPPRDETGEPLTGLSGYHVYRATSQGGPYTRLTESPHRSRVFNDPDAPPASYYVTSVDYAMPPNESGPSATVSSIIPALIENDYLRVD